MKIRHIAGWLYIVVAAVAMLAAAVLVGMNWGNKCQEFSLYWKSLHDEVPVGLLMFLSGVGGVAIYFCARLLIIGIRAVRRERRALAQLRANQDAQQQAQADQPPPGQ